MSLARQFFREFRPLFRMLEEPLGRSPAYGWPRRFMFEDPLFRFPEALRPAVDVTEHGNKYIIEAELPGVRKDDIQVRINDGGRSVTIEGKIVKGREAASQPEAGSGSFGAGSESGTSALETQGTEGNTSEAVTTTPETNQISSERSFVGASSFTRTVWLPRQVDPSNVVAKHNDGVLTLEIPKAEDPGSVRINIQ